MGKLLVIQPWFTAKGHPAQSLLNTARVLKSCKDISYLISEKNEKKLFNNISQELSELGELRSFCVNSSSLQEGTAKALLYLFQHRKKLEDTTIFFLDGHLIVLAFCWLFLRCWVRPKRVGLLYLKGSERICQYWFTRKLTAWWLGLENTLLYLRTEELQKDWQNFFPHSANKIRTIPSLELPNVAGSKSKARVLKGKEIHFGVIGQIRKGKGLEWLVPLFQAKPELGELTVAGTFYSETEEKSLPQLQSFKGFRNEFLSESDMLECAMDQDYLLMLYDDWDSRMESAILYLAAKAKRPVIAYDQGWCGRKVTMFGCGLLIPYGNLNFETFLYSVPKPDSKEYAELLKGVDGFVHAHSGERAKEDFLNSLLE